jgi:hypothetical protein
MTNELGDAPIEDAYRAKMVALVRALDDFLNDGARGPDRKLGFVVMVFPFGEGPGRCNYISNGVDRDDVVALMKEQIKRFEGAPDVTGQA